MNLYGYVLQSPTNNVDPFGLDCKTWWFIVTCNHDSSELWTKRRAEEAHEAQHVRDNIFDPWNWHRSCEEKERRAFEQQIEFLKSTIETLEGRKTLTRYSQRDLEQAKEELKDNEERVRQPNYFKDYCKLSRRP